MSIHHKSTPSWGQKESSREEVRSQADTPKGVCFQDYQFFQDNLLLRHLEASGHLPLHLKAKFCFVLCLLVKSTTIFGFVRIQSNYD